MAQEIAKTQGEPKVEELYRELVETAFDLVYSHDLDGNFVSVSESTARLVGYSQDEILRMNISHLVVPEDLEVAREMIAKKLRGSAITSYEMGVVVRNGQVRSFEITSCPIFESGKIVGIQGIGREITERNKAEKRREVFSTLGQRLSSARKPEEAARVLSEVTGTLFDWDFFLLELYDPEKDEIEPILTIDTVEGQRIDFTAESPSAEPSPRERRILENGPELILRKVPVEFSTEATALGNMNRASASLLYAQIRDGTSVCGLLSIQSYKLGAYCSNDLQVLQALAEFCGEALVRIRAQEELRQSEEKYRAIFEHAIAGFSQTSVAGRFLAANPALARILGYLSSEDLIEKVTDIGKQVYVDPNLRSEFLNLIQRDGMIRGREFQAYRKDGTTTWVSISATVVRDEAGGVAYIQAVFEDIMERKSAETEIEHLRTQLLHIQRLESIGQLASGVAHDFNNLLTIIHGYTSLLQMKDPLPISVEECLSRISEASQRGAELTRHLLNFGRKQARNIKRLDLNTFVKKVLPVLKRVIPESIGIELESHAHSVLLDADAGMLETVIVNLATNARDAMPDGGKIVFQIKIREIDEAYAQRNRESSVGSHACLIVKDTGRGMDSTTMNRVFEPFFTTKDVGKGTGLGLSAAYGIVKQHKGWIEIESVKGTGTTFQVYFPAAVETAEEPNFDSLPISNSFNGSEIVLLVEDDTSLRRLTGQVLRSFGYCVIEARTGKEALELWPKHSRDVDLLFTDIVMPDGISGGELAVRLKNEKPKLRVIFTTGYNPKSSDSVFLFKEGINFIEKPYRSEALGKIVRRALDCERSENEFRVIEESGSKSGDRKGAGVERFPPSS